MSITRVAAYAFRPATASIRGTLPAPRREPAQAPEHHDRFEYAVQALLEAEALLVVVRQALLRGTDSA
jgi:hypothetical protein